MLNTILNKSNVYVYTAYGVSNNNVWEPTRSEIARAIKHNDARTGHFNKKEYEIDSLER